jgi:hypothetical protein
MVIMIRELMLIRKVKKNQEFPGQTGDSINVSQKLG